MPDPTRAEADEIIQQVKTIGEDVSWQAVPGCRTPRWHLRASIVAPQIHGTLRITGKYGKTNWAFTLLANDVPIRKLTYHRNAPHRNPDGTTIRDPHKHRWDEINRDREAYVPDDIDFSDVNQAFLDFLHECNITLHGRYQQLIPI